MKRSANESAADPFSPAAALGKLDFQRRFADHFGIPAEGGTANLGLDHLIGHAVPAESHLPRCQDRKPEGDCPGIG